MNIHDETAEPFALAKPRPLVVRIVDRENGQVANEFQPEPHMTGPEIAEWLKYLESTCGPKHEIELNGEAA